MAQRRREGVALASALLFGTGALLPLAAGTRRQSEECQSVPTRARNRNRDRAEGAILLMVIAKPFRQNLYDEGSPLPLAREQSSRQRQAAIFLPTVLIASRSLNHALAAHSEEAARRDHT